MRAHVSRATPASTLYPNAESPTPNRKTGVEGKTDLFFLCKARPLSSTITLQEAEIARAEWMPLSEYLSKPLWPDYSAYWWMSRLAAEAFLQGKGHIPGHRLVTPPTLFTATHLPLGSRPGFNYVYSSADCPAPVGDHEEARGRWLKAKNGQSRL
jgi:hypothetical protein